MKLGTQTGSLTNHILSRQTIGQPEPIEGMGATVLCWTDRHAGTIINISKAHAQTVIYIREDKAIRTDSNGMDESQSYRYEADPAGGLYTFRQTKTGGWEQVELNEKTGRLNKVEGGRGLRIGERGAYHDYSF